jgi:hypothetical protein
MQKDILEPSKQRFFAGLSFIKLTSDRNVLAADDANKEVHVLSTETVNYSM